MTCFYKHSRTFKITGQKSHRHCFFPKIKRNPILYISPITFSESIHVLEHLHEPRQKLMRWILKYHVQKRHQSTFSNPHSTKYLNHHTSLGQIQVEHQKQTQVPSKFRRCQNILDLIKNSTFTPII